MERPQCTLLPSYTILYSEKASCLNAYNYYFYYLMIFVCVCVWKRRNCVRHNPRCNS
jgi:hypothetical protein